MKNWWRHTETYVKKSGSRIETLPEKFTCWKNECTFLSQMFVFFFDTDRHFVLHCFILLI